MFFGIKHMGWFCHCLWALAVPEVRLWLGTSLTSWASPASPSLFCMVPLLWHPQCVHSWCALEVWAGVAAIGCRLLKGFPLSLLPAQSAMGGVCKSPKVPGGSCVTPCMHETQLLRVTGTEMCNWCSSRDPISARLYWFIPLYDLTIHIYLKCCQIQGILYACVAYTAFRMK